MGIRTKQLETALSILSAIVSDSLKIDPDNVIGETRADKWKNWAVEMANKKMAREGDKHN